MLLLLDTTVLIDVLRGSGDRRKFLAELVKAGHSLSTTAINIAEIYSGMRAEERIRTEEFIGQLDCLVVDCEASRMAGDLKRQWAAKGRTLALADTLIASMAMTHGYALVTDNQKDFPMAELELYPLPDA